MKIKQPFSYAKLLLYVVLYIAMLFLRHIGNFFEPFSIALFYAMVGAGLSPYISALLYVLSVLPNGAFIEMAVSLGQAFLLCLAFLLERRFLPTRLAKSGLFSMLALSLSLAGYVAFVDFSPYPLPFNLPFLENQLTQKIIIACIIFLLSAIFLIALKCILYKFLKCRLRGDERVFCSIFLLFVGVGLCRFLGLNAYLGVAFFVLLVLSYATKDYTALFCAFVLSLPPLAVFFFPMQRFFIYGIIITLFMRIGRLASACAFLLAFFGFAFMDGVFSYQTPYLVENVLSAVLPALFFILCPTPLLRELENRVLFYREKHLSRIAINRNRAAIGRQLYEISAMFREIENTFLALSEDGTQKGAKNYIRGCVIEEVCKRCAHYPTCRRKNVFNALDNLIDVGCMKGKSSVIDLPVAIADVCTHQNDLLTAVNRQLTDYRKYMTETENAKNGRTLLAGQAQGVSEILRNLALEQSEPLKIYTEKERALTTALLSIGIVCSEVLLYGEEDCPVVSLITFGRADVKKIADVVSHLFQTPMMISQRLTLSQDKFCCILRKKPTYDAAFGVSTVKKTGEIASGDTHSVIKIDEKTFMVALADGMGSGEYARRISTSTISLLESFYRAKMPPDCILSTVNKLLTFGKEESFTCVDIGVVDLENGRTDIVKIGSPNAFILSGNTVKILESNGLPLGILDNLHPYSATYELLENDVLLFVSDGITGAFPSSTDLYDTLKDMPTGNPQQLTECLLRRALQNYGGVAKDDMTAVAVRLFRADLPIGSHP